MGLVGTCPHSLPVQRHCFHYGTPHHLPRLRSLPTRACPFRSLLEAKAVEELPFKPSPPGKPYRLLLGLRPPQGPWLHVVEDEAQFMYELGQRRKHLDERRDVVLQLLDEPLALAAAQELLEQVSAELALRCPQRFTLSDDGAAITNLLTGERFDVSDAKDPLRTVGLLVQEDFCLLSHTPEHYDGHPRLLGGVVCFPAHWTVLEKLGQDVTTIHDPVPRWKSDASALVHNFLTRLALDKPLIRWNWTLSATDELHLSRFYKPPNADLPDPTAAEPLRLRLERQYFHRMPRTGVLVFTIRTYMERLGAAVEGRPVVAEALAGALQDLPFEHLVYKSETNLRMPSILRMLEGVFKPAAAKTSVVAAQRSEATVGRAE